MKKKPVRKSTRESYGESLLRSCYSQSIKLLKENSRSSGIIACAKSEKAVARNYASIFGRDAAICSLGMVASGDSLLVRKAQTSLITLAEYQAPNGQIPKYVKPESREVDFWYAGCIDATLWWLIAIHFFDRNISGGDLKRRLRKQIESAKIWLGCHEHQGFFLIQQNEASDWADIMPRSGFVLYTNALWSLVKSLYRIPGIKKTRYYFSRLFSPFSSSFTENRRAQIMIRYIRKKAVPDGFYLSFVNFSDCGEEIDVFGNILAMLFRIMNRREARGIVDQMLSLKINTPFPVRAVENPIRPDSPRWRDYMYRHRQNLPYQYHNGGIWPFVGGFWVILLHTLGYSELAVRELGRVAEANHRGSWGFHEWLHGMTGRPMGMAGQSWNAGMFILAYHTLYDKKDTFQLV